MIWALAAAAVALALIAGFSTLIQILYLESLRLRARETRALSRFKEVIEERMGLKPAEQGALAFSLVKHISLAVLTVIVAWMTFTSSRSWQGFAEATVLAVFLMLVSTYLAPHLVYRRTSAAWLDRLVPAARVLALAVSPLMAWLNFLHSLAELSEPEGAAQEEATPAEHIEALITAGEEEGLIEEGDRELIQSVVEFGDKTVREVMTPRPNIVAIEKGKSLEELRQLVIHEQYSRIPVFDGTIDNIIGFVHVRDMFELDEEERKTRKVEELVRELKPVPETKRVSELLKEMQASGAHMAVVVDEYGNTAGIATMEDLVEEVFGEIRDEHEPASDVTREPDGSLVVSGSYELDRLEELIGFRPQEETESTTIGGLATEWLGRVPNRGERIEREGIRIEVLAGSDRRVEKVRISRLD
jgi:CBS domain containing-hemolysin-like protein